MPTRLPILGSTQLGLLVHHPIQVMGDRRLGRFANCIRNEIERFPTASIRLLLIFFRNEKTRFDHGALRFTDGISRLLSKS